MAWRRGLALICVVGLSGCIKVINGGTGGDDAATGTSGSTTDDPGPTTSMPITTSTSGVSTDAGLETGQPPNCQGFEDEGPTGEQLQVDVRNNLQERVVLLAPVPCGAQFVQVTSQEIGGMWLLGECESTCAQQLQGDCMCEPGCQVGQAILMEPGAAYTTSWDATTYVPEQLPPECVLGPDCQGNGCSVLRAAQPGPYSFSVVASAESEFCQQVACDCQPGPDGWCDLGNVDPFFPGSLFAEQFAMYPEEPFVEITIQ